MGVKPQFPLHLTSGETTEEAALLYEYLLGKDEILSGYYFTEDEVVTIYHEYGNTETTITMEHAMFHSGSTNSFIVFKPYIYWIRYVLSSPIK